MTLLELVVRYDNFKTFYVLWNTPNVKWAQIMLNGFRGQKRLSFLICNLNAAAEVRKLRSEWRVRFYLCDVSHRPQKNVCSFGSDLNFWCTHVCSLIYFYRGQPVVFMLTNNIHINKVRHNFLFCYKLYWATGFGL